MDECGCVDKGAAGDVDDEAGAGLFMGVGGGRVGGGEEGEFVCGEEVGRGGGKREGEDEGVETGGEEGV